jgi:hypothetical protein
MRAADALCSCPRGRLYLWISPRRRAGAVQWTDRGGRLSLPPMPTLHRLPALVIVALTHACQSDPGVLRVEACEHGLLPGDLVITEVFADAPGSDDGAQWFEIYNATKVAQELSGLIVRASKADGSAEKHHLLATLSIDAEGYLVLGDALEPEAHVDYAYANELGDLPNRAGALAIGCSDGTELDAVAWMDATEGVSRGFDGSREPDAAGNDITTAWCDATTPFAEDIVATPGTRNDPCLGGGLPTTCTEDGITRELVAPVHGDLVISEFQADPEAVDDELGEWFEIYVAADVDLNGVAFGKLPGEPEGELAGAACIRATAGSYLVLARNDDPEQNGGLPRVDGRFEFGLGNSSGALVLSYGDLVLDDALAWSSVSTGAASSLDPDALAADDNDIGHFCPALTPYGQGDLGTPGAANDVECAIAPPMGQCLDGDALVEVIAPAAGELVITEVHADPDAVDDADGEWFELRANAAVHLNGLELGLVVGEPKHTIAAEACIAIGLGEHVVLARASQASDNGGLPMVRATFGFALANHDAGLYLASAGTVIDAVAWSSSSPGVASSLDPDHASARENDDAASWCAAVDGYGDGDLGTPGAANPRCGGESPRGCDDGGSRRARVPPGPGDLVITEVMPNPAAVTDADGEWFELLVRADVDLNGLQLYKLDDTGAAMLEQTVDDDACVAVAAGTRLLFARETESASNGGLPVVDHALGFGLVNADAGVAVGIDDVVLDEVRWTSTPTGASRSLDPGAEDPAANDDDGAWCPGVSVYGDGDHGTPGAANDAC